MGFYGCRPKHHGGHASDSDLFESVYSAQGAVPPTLVGGPTNPLVGNAKFPGPFIECKMGEHVFITVHNRRFFQYNQAVQDDHTLHLHGIHAQAPYDGFPETAGSYKEKLRYFWQEPWYIALGATTKARDIAWNAMTMAQQMTLLKANTPLIKDNFLDPMGAILSQFGSNAVEGPWPLSVGYNASSVLTDPRIWGSYAQMYGPDSNRSGYSVEDATQFTYYFTPMHMGTFMYHCHMVASEHVQMGMYGAIVIRPADWSQTKKTVYGRKTNTDYDTENTIIISEFDPRWHRLIEGEIVDPLVIGFRAADWKPELWFANGRTFPQTILPFAWNTPCATPTTFGPPDLEPRYNTLVTMKTNQKFLIRWINMGYQEHPMHQHEWHTSIVGKDGVLQNSFRDVFTILIGSRETYDTITLANPVYGVTDPAGSPLSSPHPSALDPNGKPTIIVLNTTILSKYRIVATRNSMHRAINCKTSLNSSSESCVEDYKWRQIFPIHDHDDYRVTTNDLYPGGAVVLQVVTDVPNTPANTPTWFNPFLNNGAGGMDVIP
jgi:FtsP/CotA-like multicopper oxidase with cupredoxin domain